MAGPIEREHRNPWVLDVAVLVIVGAFAYSIAMLMARVAFT